MRAAIRPLGQRLRAVRTAEVIWPIVVEASTIFGAVGLKLRLGANDSGAVQLSSGQGFEDPPAVVPGPLFRAQFSIPGGKPAERALELAWSDDRKEIDRDTEIAVDIFCEYLADAIDATKGAGVTESGPLRARPPA